MATFERPKSTDSVPLDLLPVIRNSGVLPEKQLAEIKSKILHGEYPMDSIALAECLVRDKILTSYQVKRFLSNRSNGLIVGRYVILDRIGSGSMGRVYKAHHVMMDRVVALKIISPEIASNERVVARFHREMKLVGRLDHPNVVRAFDADQVQKVLYIVMEFVPGYSLGERLKKGPIPPLEMIDYASQAALGLAHAHDQGIVHRDIKPSNMLLNREGRIKILDLGLGVLMEADNSATFATADGIAVGTVDYMSPEQACGRDVDGRSDLYGLGCAMYHLMTGRLPFPGTSPIERLGKRISGRHVPITEHLPEMPSSFVRILDKMMAHKPHERFATATEVAEALQGLIRPKAKSVGAAGSGAAAQPSDKAVAADARANEAKAPPAPPPPPVIVEVRPKYPGWFAPLAEFVERRPRSALAGAILTMALTFGAGLALGFVLK
jgi:eukaryotic-like serine/threonine-protein kinase